MKPVFGVGRYANVTSTLALVVALGGTSYAAIRLPRNSVGSAQLKSAAVKSSDLGTSSVSSSKVKDGSLLTKDFKAGQIPPGAAGARGPQGATGATGATGAAGATGASATIGDNSIGAAKITDGGLGARDIGRFAGSVTLDFGTIDLGDCTSITTTSLTAIVAGQDIQDDLIVVTPQSSFPSDGVSYNAKPVGTNQFEVTVCNVEGPATLNLGSRTLRYVTIDAAGA